MKPGRNDACPCGSGKKFKKCCEAKTAQHAPAPQPAATAELLRTAVDHHQAGRLRDAAKLYGAILEQRPDDADALHLLGMVKHQTGSQAEAEALIRKAIAVDGTASLFHVNLGNVLRQQGRPEEAMAAFRKALALQPGLAEAHHNLANLLCDGDDAGAAVSHYEKALLANPRLAEAHYNLGVALRRLGRNAEAAASYERAVALQPGHANAHYNLGLLLQEEKQYQEAAMHYTHALKSDPANAQALCYLGHCLLMLEQYDLAEAAFRSAVSLKDDSADAWNDLSVALRKQGRIPDALAAARKSIEVEPGFEAYNNLGIACREDGRLEEAVENAEKAAALNPDAPDVRWNLALALLHRGDLAAGWEAYEWRGSRTGSDIRTAPFPRWNGGPLTEKTLFVYAEQGVGDQIMFASLLPELLGRKPKNLIIDCDRRLAPLFSRSFPGITVLPAQKEIVPAQLPPVDAAVPLGSLPLHVRPELRSFPRQHAYLMPEADKVAFWRGRYDALGPGLRVGISWRGGSEASVRSLRSTALAQWAGLLSIPGVHFVNLQYGDCTQELEAAQKELGVAIRHWEDADPLKDLDGFAAQVAALDLVISVDNATVHMAGALGVPAWVLLPRACDWRWMKGVEDSPWYASLRLFRQRSQGDWSAVFMLAGALLARAAAGADSPAELTAAISFSAADLAVPVRRPSGAAPGPGPVAPGGVDEQLNEQEKYRKAWGLENRVYAQYSPGLQISEHVNFLDYFRSNGVHTILDAGIGSGKLCKKMLGLGFDCRGLDIADNCLDADLQPIKDRILTIGTMWDSTLFRENSFDAVVCTDVLEHIHERHIEDVLANFHSWTKRFVFLQVALYDDVFGTKVGAPLHLTVKPKTWWDARMKEFTIIRDFALKGADNTDRYAVYLLEKKPVSPSLKLGGPGKQADASPGNRPDLIDKPIFVLGVARSGTSMVAGLLKACGAWAGRTVQASPENPRGFYEHVVLREKVNKKILTHLHCDPLGVRSLPGLDRLPEMPDLAGIVKQAIRSEGYAGGSPWLFKDAKLSLLWPLYKTAFPEARWIIVRRSKNDIIRSCLKTGFMAQHSKDPSFWDRWIDEYLVRLEALKQSGVWLREIWAHDVVSGDFGVLRGLIDDLGLHWDEQEVQEFILPGSWHAEKVQPR